MTLNSNAIHRHCVNSSGNRESGCNAILISNIGWTGTTTAPRQRCESENPTAAT